MMSETFIQWYDYHIWANERVLHHLRVLPGELFRKEVNFGFTSIAEVIGHLVSADEVWFSRIKEEGSSSMASKPFPTIEEAGKSMHALQSQIREYLIAVPDFEKKVTYSNSLGLTFQNSIAEILQQIVNHGTYHRGNITTMLRSLGYEGVQTDYIAFLRAK